MNNKIPWKCVDLQVMSDIKNQDTYREGQDIVLIFEE